MLALTSRQQFELKKFVKELRDYRGRHTELVTVYIPQGYDIIKIIQHLEQEKGTASNIKSASTRKNVQDALERMIQHLKLFKRTPPNGLAAFSGNIAAREGRSNVQVWSLEPPVPLKIRIYRCDKTFVLEPLEEMLEVKECYGLVVMDRRDANIALLKGKTIIPLRKSHSEVPGKQRAGGQCLHPLTLVKTNSLIPLIKLKINDDVKSFDFEKNKIIQSKIIDKWNVTKDKFIEIITGDNTKIISSLDHLFFTDNKKEKPAEKLTLKDSLLKIENKRIVPVKIKSIKKIEKITNLIDISVKNQNFIANGLIVHNSAQRFARLREGAAKDHYKKVAAYVKNEFLKLKDLKGILVGGPGPTKYDFIEYITTDLKNKIIAVKDLSYTGDFGLQELLERSKDILAQEEVIEEKKIMNKFFTLLAKQPGKVGYGEKDVYHKLETGVVDTLLLSESLEDEKIEKFEKKAEELGTEVRIISTETREGVQLRDLGKVAAIYRYDVGE